MSDPYVLEAATGHVRGLAHRGLLRSRPVRFDGFTGEEIDLVIPAILDIVSPGRVCVLSPITSEAAGRVNAERATRYRNEVDAGSRPGFVLFVPHGMTPESSLNEPAFLVTSRDGVFTEALEFGFEGVHRR